MPSKEAMTSSLLPRSIASDFPWCSVRHPSADTATAGSHLCSTTYAHPFTLLPSLSYLLILQSCMEMEVDEQPPPVLTPFPIPNQVPQHGQVFLLDYHPLAPQDPIAKIKRIFLIVRDMRIKTAAERLAWEKNIKGSDGECRPITSTWYVNDYHYFAFCWSNLILVSQESWLLNPTIVFLSEIFMGVKNLKMITLKSGYSARR